MEKLTIIETLLKSLIFFYVFLPLPARTVVSHQKLALTIKISSFQNVCTESMKRPMTFF